MSQMQASFTAKFAALIVVNENNAPTVDHTVMALEGLDVLDGQERVAVLRSRIPDVDHDTGSHEAFQRDRIRGVLTLGEVNRCIDVRSSVLGGSDRERAVEVAALDVAPREPHAGLRSPEVHT